MNVQGSANNSGPNATSPTAPDSPDSSNVGTGRPQSEGGQITPPQNTNAIAAPQNTNAVQAPTSSILDLVRVEPGTASTSEEPTNSGQDASSSKSDELSERPLTNQIPGDVPENPDADLFDRPEVLRNGRTQDLTFTAARRITEGERNYIADVAEFSGATPEEIAFINEELDLGIVYFEENNPGYFPLDGFYQPTNFTTDPRQVIFIADGLKDTDYSDRKYNSDVEFFETTEPDLFPPPRSSKFLSMSARQGMEFDIDKHKFVPRIYAARTFAHEVTHVLQEFGIINTAFTGTLSSETGEIIQENDYSVISELEDAGIPAEQIALPEDQAVYYAEAVSPLFLKGAQYKDGRLEPQTAPGYTGIGTTEERQAEVLGNPVAAGSQADIPIQVALDTGQITPGIVGGLGDSTPPTGDTSPS